MATGDIISCTINGGGSSQNGFTADIVIAGFKAGGAYDFGLSEGNSPVGATMVFSVRSPGYDASGSATHLTRTVYGVPDHSTGGAQRKAYSDLSPQETEGGGNLTLRVILSEQIYASDDQIALMASGFYTDSGSGGSSAPSNAVTALSVTNNSTMDYPKVVGRWAIAGRDIVGNTLNLERACFSKFARNSSQVACTKFTISDGTTTLTSYVTSMSQSLRGDFLGGLYCAAVDITSLINNHAISVQAQDYPWIGDTDSVNDTTGGPTQPATDDGPLTFWKQTDGQYVIYVSQAAGSSEYGSADFDDTVAQGQAAQSVDGAILRLDQYNTVFGTKGGIVKLTGFYPWKVTTARNDYWMTVTNGTGVARSAAGLTSNVSTGRQADIDFLKLYNITLDNTGDSQFILRGKTGYHLLAENCALKAVGPATLTWQFDTADMIGCTCDGGGIYAHSTDNAGTLSRCNTLTNGALTTGPCCIGNIGGGITMPGYDNGVCYGNQIFGVNTSATALAEAGVEITHGFAFVLNLIEVTTGGNKAVACYADDNTLGSNHMIWQHNSLIGERTNAGYMDDDGTHAHTNWSWKYCYLHWWPTKHDAFYTNAAATGGWSVMDGVGCVGNHSYFNGTSYDTAFAGLLGSRAWGPGDTPVAAGFVGGGDYTPADGTSTLARRIPAGEAVLPFDLDGVAIPNDGTGYAGAMQGPALSEGGGGSVGGGTNNGALVALLC